MAVGSTTCLSVSFIIDNTIYGSHLANDAENMNESLLYVKTMNFSDVLSLSGFANFSLVCDIEGAEYYLMDQDNDNFIQRCQSATIEIHNHKKYTPNDLVNRLKLSGLLLKHKRNNVFGFSRK